jgi:hypothetical protein
MNDSFEGQIQKLRWEATKERRDWLRWIVPIETVLLGLSVSLYKPEISLHHPHPSLLKLAWGTLALSIVCGVVGATAVATVREDLAKEMLEAEKADQAYKWSMESAKYPIRQPNFLVRACQNLCPVLLAIGLVFLVLFAVWL